MRAGRTHDEGDAWDAVVTGRAPSARRLRGDPRMRAQWDEARQVESRLRQGLGLLAEEARLQKTEPETTTDAETKPGTVDGDAYVPVVAGAARRWRRGALVVAAAVVVGLGAAVVGLEPWSRDDGGSEQGTASLSDPGVLACAQVVAQGHVDEVETVSGGRVEMRITVREYLKPRKDPGGQMEVTTSGRAELHAGIEAVVVVYPDRPDASVYPGESGSRLLARLRPYAAEPDTLPRCEGTG